MEALVSLVGRTWLTGSTPHVEPARYVTFVAESELDADADEVLNFCLDGMKFSAIMPDPLDYVWATSLKGTLGGVYVFRWWMKRLVPFRWVAVIDSLEPGREFSDLQLRGMFRYFHHTHTCVTTATGKTLYRDTVRYKSAFGPFVDRVLLSRELSRVFTVRHRRMALLLGLGV